MVAQTRHANKVVFRDKLAGKGLSIDQIIKKLQGLLEQLEKQDQDDVDKNSLSTARAELIHKTILLHKDQGVRAYTACCLAELLRLYAPDAPYTPPELRDIFQFFVRQLKEGLKHSETAYHGQYFQLLESLSTVKSAVLVCDLPGGDELMLEFFTTFFYIVRRGTANKKMESFMGDILVAILDECQSVPQTVLDMILAQFMDKDTRMEQPAYRLAVMVCNAVADKLQRPVTQYFADIIVESAQGTNSPSSDDDEDDKFEQLQNAHELIKRLHHSCPAVLHGVIPQLAEELRVDHVNIRQLATQALGEMYADNHGAELATKYPATWDVWISRKNDKAVAIRLKFVESLKELVASLPIKREALAEALGAKLLDPDDKIRTAVCKVFFHLDYESALHNVSEELLRAVAERFLDKKAPVRSEALNSLGKLYSLAYPEIENNDAAAVKHFGWIPESILEVTGQSPLVRDVVERVWAVYILPLASSRSKTGEVDEVLWTEKLLNVMRHLSDKSIEILVSISTIKESRPGTCDKYLDACIRYNGGVIDEDEEKITQTLNESIHALTAWVYSGDAKASEDLHAFAKLNENRLYKLLKTCFNPQTDIKSLAKSSGEFIRRLDQSSVSLTTTLSTLLYRGSFNVINHSSIPTLLKKIQKRRASTSPSAQVAGANSATLLKNIAKWAPRLSKNHLGELFKCVSGESMSGESGGDGSSGNTELVEVGLKMLGNLARGERDVNVGDKKIIERMTRFALKGERKQAKFAVRFLALSNSGGDAAARVLEKIVDKLKDAEDADLAAHVAAVVEFARYAPEMFEEHSDVILEHLVRRVINVPIPDENPQGDEDSVEEWYEDLSDVPSLLWAKISALKVLRHRCLNAAAAATVSTLGNTKTHANGQDKGKEKEVDKEKEKGKAEKIVGPVVKMLQALMVHEGSMRDGIKEDPKVRSRMRLQASLTMLHLSRMEVYSSIVTENFAKLALTIQDTCYGVRSIFLNKLITLFVARKLPPPLGVVFFLTVHDPEEDVRNSAATCVRSLLKKLNSQQRVEYFELLLVRLLHTLAHHPDFSTTHEDLLDLAKYIQFYLDLVATSDDVSLLYHLATKGKTVRDHTSFTYSENFYILCELAQDLIKVRAAAHSWSIQSYPGKVRMPADILRPLPSVEAANRILKTSFLPDETREWISTLSHQQQARGGAQKKERKATSTTGDGKADGGSAVLTGKRKSRGKANGSAKKRRKGKDKWDSDENDDDESDEDEERQEGPEQEEAGGEGEEEDEGSDVEMKGVSQGKGKGKTRNGTQGKKKPTTKPGTKLKPKAKSKQEKAEDDREARKAKGLRTSARTKTKAQASRKKPRLEESADEEGSEEDSDKMET